MDFQVAYTEPALADLEEIRGQRLPPPVLPVRPRLVYREQILEEPTAPEGFIPLETIAPAKKEEREEVGSFDDF